MTTPTSRIANPIDDITIAAPDGGRSVSGHATRAVSGG